MVESRISFVNRQDSSEHLNDTLTKKISKPSQKMDKINKSSTQIILG